MTKKEFYSYLLDFLTLEDARNLEAYALESLQDVNEGILENERFTEDDAREHVLDMIQFGDLTFDDLEMIFERQITEEERKSIEWRF